MRALALVLTLTLLATQLHLATGQAQVERCAQECDPAAINGGTIKRGDEPVKVVLYAHYQDALQVAPVNTQPPHPELEPDLNAGFLMPVVDTNTGLGCAQGNCLDFHFRSNDFTLFSSPGLVEYLTDGWRIHEEPGLAADVRLVENEFNLYFYLSAYGIPGQNSHSSYPDVGAMPQVGVYARVETGRHPFSKRATLIAESVEEVTPAVSDRRANMVTVPGAPDVYEFQVRMKVVTDTIPSGHESDGFVVRISPYQIRTETNPDKGHQVMQEEWRLRTGPRFPTRLVLPVEHTMESRAKSLTLFQDLMFVRWSFLSMWGSYDMRDADLKLESTGPNPVDLDRAAELIILKKSIDHDGHFKPVNATWSIDYQNFPLKDGDYELTASIPNLQGTYLLEEKFPFRVVNGVPDVPAIGPRPVAVKAGSEGQAQGEAPGLDAVAFGVALGAALVAGRRRR